LQTSKILLHQKFGFGDALQYSRFIPQVHKVTKPCTIDLLIKGNFYLNWVDPTMPPPSSRELYEKLYGDYLGNIYIDGWDKIAQTSYLERHELRGLQKWFASAGPPKLENVVNREVNNKFFKMDGKPRIGFCYQGSPGHPRDNERSCEKLYFTFLSNKFPEYSFYSLQLDENSGIIESELDVLSIIQELDLVISVDSYILHLAGLTDTPVWSLHDYDLDVRWKGQTNWYPNMKMFIQPNQADWDNVFINIHEELERKKDDNEF